MIFLKIISLYLLTYLEVTASGVTSFLNSFIQLVSHLLGASKIIFMIIVYYFVDFFACVVFVVSVFSIFTQIISFITIFYYDFIFIGIYLVAILCLQRFMLI